MGGTRINEGSVAVGADNVLGAANGGLTFNGGTLQLNSSFDLSAGRAITLNALGDTIDTQAFSSSIAQGIGGAGALTKAGAGTLTLAGNNTYVGGTTVSAGALVVGDAAHPGASLSGGGLVRVAEAGTLGGYGSVLGNVENSGTIAVANALAAASTTNGSLTLTGDLLNRGLAQVGGTGIGNSLVVAGNYAGQGGTVALNTLLGADDSPSDRLVISGGQASGTSLIRVTNVGGEGAVTKGNGIKVVDAVNGATTASGAFKLAGPVVAGPYEYTLYRGSRDASAADSWFLRTSADDPSGPAVTPQTERPNYRQEVSLYTAIPSLALLYGRTLLDTLHERVGDEAQLRRRSARDGDTVAWGRIIGQRGEVEGSARGIYENGPGFDYRLLGAQAGLDLYQDEHKDGSRDHAGFTPPAARSGAT
nr:autotransporter-associated beta strand repeat-containing protein [Crenobacter cavernae]